MAVVLAAVVVAVVVLRCGSGAAEEDCGIALRAGGAAAAPGRCAAGATFSLPPADVGLSGGASLQDDDGGGGAKSLGVEDLADRCEVTGEATRSLFCLIADSER